MINKIKKVSIDIFGNFSQFCICYALMRTTIMTIHIDFFGNFNQF